MIHPYCMQTVLRGRVAKVIQEEMLGQHEQAVQLTGPPWSPWRVSIRLSYSQFTSGTLPTAPTIRGRAALWGSQAFMPWWTPPRRPDVNPDTQRGTASLGAPRSSLTTAARAFGGSDDTYPAPGTHKSALQILYPNTIRGVHFHESPPPPHGIPLRHHHRCGCQSRIGGHDKNIHTRTHTHTHTHTHMHTHGGHPTPPAKRACTQLQGEARHGRAGTEVT